MFARPSIAALSRVERHSLRQQHLATKHCIRCFHASSRQRADEKAAESKGNDQGTPSTTPAKGWSRQQRAAQLSEEVQLLAREAPAIGSSNPPDDGPRDSVSPQAQSAGDAGDNSTLAKEGMIAQVDTNPVSNDVQSSDITANAAALKENERGQQPEQRLDNVVDFTPKSYTQAELLYHNGASVMSSNFVGTLMKQINTVAEPSGHRSDPQDVLTKLGATSEAILGQRKNPIKRLHRFASREEMDAVMLAHEQASQAIETTPSETEDDSPKELTPGQQKGIKNTTWASLPDPVKETLINRFVLGTGSGDFPVSGDHAANHSVNIAKAALAKNGTYVKRDGTKFLTKLASLLPKAQASPRGSPSNAS